MLAHLILMVQSYAAEPGSMVLGNWSPPGAIAVQYFFVLSGFVMLTAHLRDFNRLGAPLKFWWRRACRIFPMYWLALGLAAVYFYKEATPGLILQMVTLAPANFTDWVSPAWSLRFEMGFYIMFGLALLPRIGKPLLAIWVVMVLWMCRPSWLWVTPALPLPYWLAQVLSVSSSRFFDGLAILFFAGLLCGWLYLKFPLSQRTGWVVLAAGIAGICASMPMQDWGYTYPARSLTLPISCSLGAFILGLANLERCGVFRTGRLATALGSVSYPLYILHMPLIVVVITQFHLPKLHMTGLYTALLGGTVIVYAISAAATFWLDQPLQRWLRQASGPGHEKAPDAAARG